MAAISGIDMDQYEAADLDGASRIQKIFRITLPNILPTISVMFVLQMGNMMSGGFDQIFNLSNPAVKEVSEILDMYIYFLRHTKGIRRQSFDALSFAAYAAKLQSASQ